MIKSKEDLFKGLEKIHVNTAKELDKSYYLSGPTLYHYTTLEAAVSILKSGSLHFSHANYCNDPNEIISGLKLLCSTHEQEEQKYKEEIDFFFDMSFIVNSIISRTPCDL